MRYLARFSLLMFSIVLAFPSAVVLRAQETPDPITTTIAFQPFQHGYMLWREDVDKITVVYGDILTKTGAPCQEVYRDTWEEQSYTIPDAPPGLTVPARGFGWLYKADAQLAQRLGYATTDEMSRLADVRTTNDDGTFVTEIAPSESLPGQPATLRLAGSDEPGLTYCFPRGREDRAVLNTWVSIQRFEHGVMTWRQDRPDRIEIGHDDTQFAPELQCLDVFADTWKPGMYLSYGDLAVPGKRLPVRGFGQVWLSTTYVRDSLGYPVTGEIGAFATITYESFKHPTRGIIQVRTMKLKTEGGTPITIRDTYPERLSAEREPLESQGCSKILIPHQARGNGVYTGPLGADIGSRRLEGWRPDPRQRHGESR
jgi:hypothetical protein